MKNKAKTWNLIKWTSTFVLLIVAVTMAGVSYAWFTETAKVHVETLNLSTKSVFQLGFDTGVYGTNEYNGETGMKMNSNGDVLLITDARAKSMFGSLEDTSAQSYLRDAVYDRKSNIFLNTDGKAVTLDISFSSLLISITDEETEEITVKKRIDTTSLSDADVGDIAYGFTWALVSVDDGTVFTPYGRLGAGSQSHIDNLSDSKPLTDAMWSTTPTKTSLTDFNTADIALKNPDSAEEVGSSREFEFHIIFAPEKMYWMQHSNIDKDMPMGDLYTSTEIGKVTEPGAETQVYYSTGTYAKADFAFDVKIEVVEVTG